MDGRKDGRTEGRKDGRTARWTNGQTDGRTDGQMDRWTEGWKHGQVDGWTDGRTGRLGGRMDGQGRRAALAESVFQMRQIRGQTNYGRRNIDYKRITVVHGRDLVPRRTVC